MAISHRNIIALYFILTLILQIIIMICIIQEMYSEAMGLLITTTIILSTMPIVLKALHRENTTFISPKDIKILGYELKEAFESKKENHK